MTRIVLVLAIVVSIAWGCSPQERTEQPAAVAVSAADTAASAAAAWQEEFTVDKAKLRTTGHNTYFILDPGHQVTLAGREGNTQVEVVISVLEATQMIDGVNCRVIEERESKGGRIVEISRNFFAIDPGTGDIYYFGEDVDNYGPDGRVRNHESAWRSGVNGARFGLIMPGQAAVGQRYYQEQAEDDGAMDRAEHLSISETLDCPAGRFTNCLKTVETSPLEPGHDSIKMYAPGVGMVRDGALQLVAYRAAR